MTEEERFMKEAIRQAKKPGFEGGSHRMRDRVRGKDHCQRVQPEKYR